MRWPGCRHPLDRRPADDGGIGGQATSHKQTAARITTRAGIGDDETRAHQRPSGGINDMTDVDIDFRTTPWSTSPGPCAPSRSQRTRAHPGSPGSDPETQPHLQRLRGRGWGAGPRRRAALDDRIAAGADPGPLAGIPLGVKDLQDAVGYTHHLWIGPPRGRPPGRRPTALRGPPRAAGLHRGRQDQHTRVRLDGQHDQRHLRPHAEPVRHIEGRRTAPRAERRRRWPPAWSPWPPAPTAAAPSASPPPAAASRG